MINLNSKFFQKHAKTSFLSKLHKAFEGNCTPLFNLGFIHNLLRVYLPNVDREGFSRENMGGEP